MDDNKYTIALYYKVAGFWGIKEYSSYSVEEIFNMYEELKKYIKKYKPYDDWEISIPNYLLGMWTEWGLI